MTELAEYYRRADMVKAAQLTADGGAFVSEFNSGRASYPLAMDSGAHGVFLITGGGTPLSVPVGSWVVQNQDGSFLVHGRCDVPQQVHSVIMNDLIRAAVAGDGDVARDGPLSG